MTRLAAIAMVLTTPLVAFWLIGDQSVGGDPNDNDYLVRLHLSSQVVLVVGLVASAILVAAAWYLHLHRTDPPDRRATKLVALLMVAGVALALGARIVTAGVIGANIGGGMFIMLGLPLCAALVIFAVVGYVRGAHRHA